MATFYEIQQRVQDLKNRTGRGSITATETFSLIDELVNKLQIVDYNQGALSVRKIYRARQEMLDDAVPVDDYNGNKLKYGQLVCITSQDADNGKIYAYRQPGWQYISTIGSLNDFIRFGDLKGYNVSRDIDSLETGFYMAYVAQPPFKSEIVPESYRSYRGAVLPGVKKMRITCMPVGIIVNGIIWINRLGNAISQTLKGNDAYEPYIHYEVDVPDDAVEFIVNSNVAAANYLPDNQLIGVEDFILNEPGNNLFSECIKFIGFVPHAAFRSNSFALSSLSCYGDKTNAAFGGEALAITVVNKTTGSRAAYFDKIGITEDDLKAPKAIKCEGPHGTLYAIIDWRIVRAHRIGNNYGAVLWNKPIYPIETLRSDDPRISSWEKPVLSGLHMGVDGDSITAGNQWSMIVSNQLSCGTHHNVAVGSAMYQNRKVVLNGKTYKTQNYYDADFKGISAGWEETTDPVEIQKRINNCAKVHVQKFMSEVNAGSYPVPDIFVFAMGVNDFTLGTADIALQGKSAYNLSEETMCTMAGGARWAIQTVMETYPNCKVFVSLPIQSADEQKNKITIQKNAILREICQALSVPVIDSYANCGICEKIETGNGPYLADGLHPNTAGMQMMAKYIGKEILNNYI